MFAITCYSISEAEGSSGHRKGEGGKFLMLTMSASVQPEFCLCSVRSWSMEMMVSSSMSSGILLVFFSIVPPMCVYMCVCVCVCVCVYMDLFYKT